MKPGKAKGRRYLGSEIVFNVILTIFVLLCVLPVIHVIAKSMSGRAPVLAGKVYLIPKELDFNAYVSVFNDPTMQTSMFFSIKWTLIYTALAMVSTILLAYPLSRHYLPGRKVLMIIVLIPMYFTGGTIANFLWVKQMGLIDSPWSLILPIMTSTYNTIILRNFFESVPASLEESAKLDGCNDFGVLFRIVLPLSLASLMTIGMFYAVAHWNSYFSAVLYLSKPELYPLQIILRQVVLMNEIVENASSTENVMAEGIKYATIVVAMLPMLCIYPFVQRYFVKGVMIGSVKE